MDHDVPTSLDWVKARSKCSLECVFQVLAEVIDSDVKSVQALGRHRVYFHFRHPASDKVIVVRTKDLNGISDAETVVFELGPTSIVAARKNRAGVSRQLFSAMLTFRADAECFLTVDGQDLRLWQVSRRALEDLFFG